MTSPVPEPGFASLPGPVSPPKFAAAAREAMADTRMRRNVRTATAALRRRTAAAAAGTADWEALREAGRAIRDRALLNLDTYLVELEEAVREGGGEVHWARDAEEACRIVVDLARSAGGGPVATVSSTVLREIGCAGALTAAGLRSAETDLAEIVLGLGGDAPSHLLLPAAHRDHAEIRELLARAVPRAAKQADGTEGVRGDGRGDGAEAVAAAVRDLVRERLLAATVAVTGADLLIAETGGAVVCEGEGNVRTAVAVADTLITVAGIESVVPTWADAEVLLQLLPRASTGEWMPPAVSAWSGLTGVDGPAAFHLVLLDNGRTAVMGQEAGRAALRCIHCSACLNVCPVYERTGGRPYGSARPGPVGAILAPLARGVEAPLEASLPYASTLCGACADVCPVKIDIPDILVHLRGEVVESRRARPVPTPELLLMRGVGWAMADRRRYESAAQRAGRWARLLSRGGRVRRLPGLLGAWTEARDLPAPPKEGFREWWRRSRR